MFREQSITLFKLTIVKFFSFKAKIRLEIPDRRVESSIYSARSKYRAKFHNAAQKAADSNRRLLIGFFALQPIRRAWVGKKGLKTAGRVRARKG